MPFQLFILYEVSSYRFLPRVGPCTLGWVVRKPTLSCGRTRLFCLLRLRNYSFIDGEELEKLGPGDSVEGLSSSPSVESGKSVDKVGDASIDVGGV